MSHQPVRSRSCSRFALSANAIHMLTSPMSRTKPKIPVGSTWLVTGSMAVWPEDPRDDFDDRGDDDLP